MVRLKLSLLFALLFAPLAVHAANCPGYSYILTNGQTADANQVMSNFNTILNCANTVLAPASSVAGLAPLANPAFTGVPTAPSATLGDASSQIATDYFVANTAATAASTHGLQSRGQLTVTASRTLTASDAGANLILATAGITLTFPSTVATYWLNNQSGGDVNLVYPQNTDYRNVIHTGEQIGLAGDGGGFWRIVAAGAPLWTNNPPPGDNSTRIASTQYVQGSLPVPATTATPGIVALATGPMALAGADTTHAVTPQSLASSQNLAFAAGFTVLPGGIYMEWGTTGTVSSGGAQTMTLAAACPTGNFFTIEITPIGAGGSGGQSYAFVSVADNDHIVVHNAASVALPFYYFVLCH